jgi:uncharacterized membrane protein YeaQ/YmgE (transglycosylase-associated protein family)
MELIGLIIFYVVWGAIVGSLARLALPGRDPMSMGQTILIGIASSVVAGIVFNILFGGGGGILGSVLVATGAVYLVRRSKGGGIQAPR